MHDIYISYSIYLQINYRPIFTFMHLADAFIQSNLQCIQAIHFYCQYMCSLGIEPITFALLAQCSNHWATGTLVMGENYVIFIAPINKWNPISRSDKVLLLANQSINLIYLRFILLPSASDSQLVSRSLLSSFVNMSSPVWKFVQRRTMPLLFATHVQQGFWEEEKSHQVLAQQILFERSSLRRSCIKGL